MIVIVVCLYSNVGVSLDVSIIGSICVFSLLMDDCYREAVIGYSRLHA